MIKNNDEKKENVESIYQCLDLRHLVFNSIFMTFTYLIHNTEILLLLNIIASVKEKEIHKGQYVTQKITSDNFSFSSDNLLFLTRERKAQISWQRRDQRSPTNVHFVTIESDLRILLSFGKVGCRSKIHIILQCMFRISASVAKTCFMRLVFTALLVVFYFLIIIALLISHFLGCLYYLLKLYSHKS